MDFNLKMEIKFPSTPLIYTWIESDYNKCESYEDYISFIHKCFNIADNTTNRVKEKTYIDTANTVYCLLTGLSYDSNNFISMS